MNKRKYILLFVLIILSLWMWEVFTTTIHINKNFILIASIGVVSSFIGTLAGGGGLITLPAMMLAGIPIQTSIATNKFATGVATLSSIFYLVYHKQLKLRTIILHLSIAVSGGIVGALITAHVSEKAMTVAAIILLLFSLIITLKNNSLFQAIQISEASSQHKISRHIIPFCIAVYDGGFGPASSTFSIVYYMKQQFAYVKAVQLTRVLIFGSCLGAFTVFYQTGFFQWPIAISMAAGSIIGAQIGMIVLPKIPIKTARILLISVIFLLITQMFYQVFH
ncbi:sulfite exporter TauE/SafE family protein [Bacillus sp. Bva_UNVM-123]|uniref:sulfite exporter TauE/SafE family protein n=1 Tax=Bacillus sp. Bva_UNVM-123 TaxID=2829798 RepID=UPI00391F8272